MAAKEGTKYRLWTKNDIEKILTLWRDTSVINLAQQLDCKPGAIHYVASRMRKAGYDLPKKSIHGHVDSLVREVLREKGLIS